MSLRRVPESVSVVHTLAIFRQAVGSTGLSAGNFPDSRKQFTYLVSLSRRVDGIANKQRGAMGDSNGLCRFRGGDSGKYC